MRTPSRGDTLLSNQVVMRRLTADLLMFTTSDDCQFWGKRVQFSAVWFFWTYAKNI